ncbi:monocarboxylate transporter 1-like isoform X1 [Lytechinus variegatus]|uniref:monocarboxylate transporter 1-like isoform X1 n=1 Tax=Lytechinus variegatus TaxID=7654 RepID=UPI001BB1BA23|nr:monocarboxylate transporter 1-like isoform X1 [Lytechinus variegatus]
MEESNRYNTPITNWKWGYAILLSKFVINMWCGIPKSFGVILPEMVDRFSANYATLGFICSIPGTITHFLGPFTSLLLERVDHRVAAMSGAVIIAVCLISCGFTYNLTVFGILLGLTGVRSFVYFPITLLLNKYFKENYVLANTLASFGITTGIMFLPIITERSLEAYGYQGVFLILGGIMLHLVAAAAVIRKPIYNTRDHITEQVSSDMSDTDASKVCYHELCDGEKCSLKIEGSQQDKRTIGESRKDATEIDEQEGLLSYDDGDIHRNPQQHSGSNPEVPEEQHNRLTTDDHHGDGSQDTFCWLLISRCKLFLANEALFLICIPSFFFYVYAFEAWVLFLVPHAEDLGISSSRAVFLSSIGGVGGLIGRLIVVVLLVRKIDMIKIYIIVGFITSLTFFLDFIDESFLVRSIWAFIQGVCFFIQDTCDATYLKFVLRDESNFSFALGLILLAHCFGSTFSGVFTGTLLDFTQSYTKVFMITGISSACFTVNVTVIYLLLKRRSASESVFIKSA